MKNCNKKENMPPWSSATQKNLLFSCSSLRNSKNQSRKTGLCKLAGLLQRGRSRKTILICNFFRQFSFPHQFCVCRDHSAIVTSVSQNMQMWCIFHPSLLWIQKLAFAESGLHILTGGGAFELFRFDNKSSWTLEWLKHATALAHFVKSILTL